MKTNWRSIVSSQGRAIRGRDWLFVACAVLVIWRVALSVSVAAGPYVAHPIFDLRGNVDWGYLNRGLDQVHSFRDTARWWTSTWCGEVPFWRPLTSYVFWGMRLLWPADHLLPRQVVMLATHLCFTALAGILLWRLTHRRWLVLLTLFLFTGLRPHLLGPFSGMPSAIPDALADPKNLPDTLVGIAMMSSLLLLVSGRWVGALIAAAVSVGCKEIGFTVWPIALVVLLWMHRDRALCRGGVSYLMSSVRKNWLPVVMWGLVLLALAAVHYHAVGVGYNCGTNRSWHWRALVYFGGPVGAALAIRDFSPPITAFVLFFAIMLSRKLTMLLRFIAILAALALGVTVDSYLLHVSEEVSAVRTLTYKLSLADILIGVLWLLLAWESRRDWQTIVLGALICFFAAIPAWMAAQVLDHARYVSSFFMEVVVAAALCAGARAAAIYGQDSLARHPRILAFLWRG